MSRAQVHNKLYITAKEWAESFGGKRVEHTRDSKRAGLRSLPFDHCRLSLQPAKDPVVTPDGSVFDLEVLVPYIQQHHRHPLTKEPLEVSQIKKIIFHRNEATDAIICPITLRTLNENSRVVVIRKSGNVFSYDAIKLMLDDAEKHKVKEMRDPLTDQPFTKEDIITIQDPNRADLTDTGASGSAASATAEVEEEPLEQEMERVNATGTMARIMEQVKKRAQERENTEQSLVKRKTQSSDASASGQDEIMYRSQTRGPAGKSAALTSTAMDVRYRDDSAQTESEEQKREKLYAVVKKLGKPAYVQLKLNVGELNLELAANLVPRTCHNFVLLCQKGYYDGVEFHRLVPEMCIQGGDPTGTGSGGQSAFGYPFRDEFHSNLKHNAAGILSMANSGVHSNGSQFFITFSAQPHLDQKHSVFGKLVGGMATLRKIESVGTKLGTSRPAIPIIILQTTVFSPNPFDEAAELLAKRAKQKAESAMAPAAATGSSSARQGGGFYSSTAPVPSQGSSGVGKYLNAALLNNHAAQVTGQKRGRDEKESQAQPAASTSSAQGIKRAKTS